MTPAELLDATTHVKLMSDGACVVAVCDLCGGQLTCHDPVSLWDLLDAMGEHHRGNHATGEGGSG